MKRCHVEGCKNAHLAKGMCSSHYYKNRKDLLKAKASPESLRVNLGRFFLVDVNRHRIFGIRPEIAELIITIDHPTAAFQYEVN